MFVYLLLANNQFKSKTQITRNLAARQDLQQDKKIFGDTGASPEKPQGKRYLDLNPDTGYGPEIITNFNFQNTDILSLTKFMQEQTGLNLVIAEDVNKNKKISITSATSITVGDAWRAYLSALNYSGYSLVKKGAFYYIVPNNKAANENTQIYTGDYSPTVDTYFMSVLHPKNVSSTTLVTKFRDWTRNQPNLQIIDIPETNKLIVSGPGSIISKIKELVNLIDVEGHKESLHYLPVKYYSAEEMADMLKELIDTSGSSSTSSARPSLSLRRNSTSTTTKQGSLISKIIPEPRTNSIIALANEQGARELKNLIKKIDIDSIGSISEKIRVYRLKHAKAEELSKVLEGIVAVKGSSGKGGSSNNLFQQDIKFTPDKDNNALIVTASPLDWKRIKPVIDELDVARLQVYIEGIIMETTLQKTQEAGLDLLALYGNSLNKSINLSPGKTPVEFLGSLTGASGPQIGFGLGDSKALSGKDILPGVKDFADTTLNLNLVNGLIKALAKSGNTNILSTPQILAMDNTKAVINIIDSLPYVDKTVTATSSNPIEGSKTEFQQAENMIEITPQVNKASKFVKMKISQKIEDYVDDAGQKGGAKGKASRKFETEISVKDQDTIVMGGFLKDRKSDSVRKVPILGDIPLLGWLFKNKSTDTTKTNLLFFWTPIILDPYETTAMDNTHRLIMKRKLMLDELLGAGKDPMKKDMEELSNKVKNKQEAPELEMKL